MNKGIVKNIFKFLLIIITTVIAIWCSSLTSNSNLDSDTAIKKYIFKDEFGSIEATLFYKKK